MRHLSRRRSSDELSSVAKVGPLKTNVHHRSRYLVCAAFVLVTASIAIGQVGQKESDGGVIKDVIPRAALLTERGRQLADQLRVLRRAEASMGQKHPNLGAVQKQIEEIKEQMRCFAHLSSLNLSTLK